MTTLQTILASINAAVRINENFAAMSPFAVYAMRAPATSGLTWGYYGGRYNGTTISDGTVTLTNGATNYIVANRSSGAVSVSTSTTNWNDQANYKRLYQVVTAGGVATAVTDYRDAYLTSVDEPMNNPMTTAGDIIIGGTPAGGVAPPTRLAPGTNGHVLTLDGGVPTWAAPTGGGGGVAIGFRAYRSASYNFTNASYAKVSLNSESFDQGGYFDSTTNFRFLPTDGVARYYYFAWQFHGTNANQGIASQLRKNGASVAEGQYGARDGTTGRSVGSDIVLLNGATDYVELYGYISSAGTPSCVGGATETRLVGFALPF